MSLWWRPRSIRTRLTLLYAVLFLASGIVLLTLVALLVFRSPVLVTFEPTAPDPPLPGMDGVPAPPGGVASVAPTWDTVRALLAQSAIGLAVMAAVSTGLGWLVAGRALRPLRTMAAKTRRISEHNLYERLAPAGPGDERDPGRWDEAGELAETIDALLARLESAFEAQRRFVANASHELRTPLAMIRTSVDVAVAKPGPVPKEVTALAAKLHEGLGTADRLLEGLLTLARAQDPGRAGITSVSLAELTASALGARAGAIAERGLTVEHRAPAEPVALHGNATLLGSLVDNLVDNAIRHNEPGGWLRIAGGADRGRVLLTVENGGPVLDRYAVAVLGRPFQRLGPDRTSREGSGLGLSIVAAVAAAHGGRLVLSARAEGGLTAQVVL